MKRKISQVGVKVTTKKPQSQQKSQAKKLTHQPASNKQRPKSSEDRTSYLKNKLGKTSPAAPVARQVKKAWDEENDNIMIYDDSNLRPQSGDSNDSGIAVS